MKPRNRIFAGGRLRDLRRRIGLDQAAMSERLAISISYLSQLENDVRPLTTSVLAALGRQFPLELGGLVADESGRRLTAAQSVLDDPLFSDNPIDAEAMARAVEAHPQLADRFIMLHAAYRSAEERLQIINETIDNGTNQGGRLPWDETRDWFHHAGNYVDLLDRNAESLAASFSHNETDTFIAYLASAHGITTTVMPEKTGSDSPLRQFDPETSSLLIGSAQSPESRRFQIVWQIVSIEMEREIAAIAESAALRTNEARRLLVMGLTNYAAGAMLMPYEAFRRAARSVRHDVDRLSAQFSVSFEQVCHRLSTLQRPGMRGIPFFFCRVDMAGNITKRHSATRLEFARFGGACPLWIVHEAVAAPDRILVQLAEAPDGVRYFSMAKGLVKPSGRYDVSPRRYALALGCEATHARDFIYADGIDPERSSVTRIGASCRVCAWSDCHQRAFPPVDRAIRIWPDNRKIVPYSIE
jgi:predicted transcriptional regulator/transcriptional regulator with XRE-family HTH domain